MIKGSSNGIDSEFRMFYFDPSLFCSVKLQMPLPQNINK